MIIASSVKYSWFLGWTGVNFYLSAPCEKTNPTVSWRRGRREGVLGNAPLAEFGGCGAREDGLTTAAGSDLKKRSQARGGQRGMLLCRPLALLGHPLRMKAGDPGQLWRFGAWNLSCQITVGQCFEHLAARRDWHRPRECFRGIER
jgi:hypothetical protein